MSATPYNDMLILVRQCIADVLTLGQSHVFRERTFTRANLSELNKMEKDLVIRAQNEANGGQSGLSMTTAFAEW